MKLFIEITSISLLDGRYFKLFNQSKHLNKPQNIMLKVLKKSIECFFLFHKNNP